MNKYKRLISNTLIFGLGTFSSKLMVYLLMPLYTELLSKSQYSTADLITQTANLLMPLAAVGICDGIFRFALDTHDEPQKKKEIFSSAMAIMTVGSLIFLLVSPVLWLFDMFDGYHWLIVVFVISANYQFACSNYVRGLGHTKMYALQGIINTALTILFNIIFLVCFDMGVLGYVLSVVVANFLVTVFLFITMKLHRDFSVKGISSAGVRALLAYSVPMIPTTIFWWVTSVSNHFIVAHFCGGDVNGIFVAAYKIPTVITILTTVFIEAWHFSAVTDSDEDDRGRFFTSVFKSFMGIVFMAASGLIAFAKIFTMLLMSDAFYGAWQYMPILVVATVFSSLTTFMGSVYLVEKKSVLAFLTSMLGGAINVALSFALIPLFIYFFDKEVGAQGAAVAALVSYFTVFLIRTINAQKYIKFSVQPIRLIINTVLILAQSAVMLSEIKGWIIIEAVVLLIVLAFNGKPIIDGVVVAIRNYKNKNKQISE